MIVNYPIAYGSKYLLSAWAVIQGVSRTFSESVWIHRDLALLSLPFQSIGIIYNYLRMIGFIFQDYNKLPFMVISVISYISILIKNG